MKTVYLFDIKDNRLSGILNVSEDSELTANQTDVVPPQNKTVKFDSDKNEWIEFEPVQPISAEIQAINVLGLQVAQLKAKLTTTDGGAS